MTYCSNCGHDIETDDSFCENCGYPLSNPKSSEVNDEELPIGIIAGFNIFPEKNKIIEFPDKYSMVIYPDVLVFAKYRKEWDSEARKLGKGQGFWARINNAMQLDETYANTYRTWPAYKVLAQDPANFSYTFKEIEKIVIDAHDGRMRTGVDLPGGISVRAGRGDDLPAWIQYEFWFVTGEGTRRLNTNYYPREINMLRNVLSDKLDERVKIIAGLPENPFAALSIGLNKILKGDT